MGHAQSHLVFGFLSNIFHSCYSKTYNYLDTVGEVTNLASGGGTELPLSEMSTYFSTLL